MAHDPSCLSGLLHEGGRAGAVTRLLHLVTVMAAARLVSTVVARTTTLLQSDASARRRPA